MGLVRKRTSPPPSNAFSRGAELRAEAACHVIFGQLLRGLCKKTGGGGILSMAAAVWGGGRERGRLQQAVARSRSASFTAWFLAFHTQAEAALHPVSV